MGFLTSEFRYLSVESWAHLSMFSEQWVERKQVQVVPIISILVWAELPFRVAYYCLLELPIAANLFKFIQSSISNFWYLNFRFLSYLIFLLLASYWTESHSMTSTKSNQLRGPLARGNSLHRIIILFAPLWSLHISSMEEEFLAPSSQFVSVWERGQHFYS